MVLDLADVNAHGIAASMQRELSSQERMHVGDVSFGGLDQRWIDRSVQPLHLPNTALERAEMRIVSETTPAGLDACRRLLPGFVDVFRILRVPNFTQPEALAALNAYCSNIERNSPVRMSDEARNLVYQLFRRFLPYEVFPGKSVIFTTQLYERAKADRVSEITSERVIGAFVKATGLPELFLRDEVSLEEQDLQAFFEHEVIGQPEACRAATRAVLTFKAGLNDPARPISVLLFTGPTGVGKTELSRSLARFLFGAAEDSDAVPAAAFIGISFDGGELVPLHLLDEAHVPMFARGA